MGAIGGLFGTAGGQSGSGIKAPQNTTISGPITAGQINQNVAAANNDLAAQQNLVNQLNLTGALNAQTAAGGAQANLVGQLGAANGVGAQTDAIAQQQALNQALSGGVGTQNAAISGLQGVAGQQAATAGQLQQIANGRGPNPAQAMLNQATGQNVANQAALMAGQRGAGANVGLIARQAAQQGAATQQQAVGQGATMQANQQIAALQGLTAQQQAEAATQSQIGGLGTTQAQMQQAGIGQQANIGAGLTAQQQAANQAYMQQGNALAAQAIQGQQNLTQAQQAQQQMNLNALQGTNNANVQMQGNINSANAGLTQQVMKGQQNLIGGALQGAAVGIAGAKGGLVKKYADGGETDAALESPNNAPVAAAAPTAPVAPKAPTPGQGPQSSIGKQLNGMGNFMSDGEGADPLQKGGNQFVSSLVTKLKGLGTSSPEAPVAYAGSDMAAAPASMAAAKGGMAKKHDYRSGGGVKAQSPKEKAVKKGDSYDNDKIKAVLSEGEIVLPRSVTQSKDPVRSAADFVAKIMAKKRKAS